MSFSHFCKQKSSRRQLSQSRASLNQIYCGTKTYFFALFSPFFHFQCWKWGTLKQWVVLGHWKFTFHLQISDHVLQPDTHSANFPSVIGTPSSETNVMCFKCYVSCLTKWSLQGNVLRGTIVLHYPVSVLGSILCLYSSKQQQSNLSPICPEKSSARPGLPSLTSLWVYKYGRLVVGTNTSRHSCFSSPYSCPKAQWSWWKYSHQCAQTLV